MSDENETDDETTVNEREIWGDRAESLTLAMRTMTRPTCIAQMGLLAQRKGWTRQTLDGVLAYCERAKLIESYHSFKGPAWRLTDATVESARAVDGDDTEVPAPAPVRAPKKEKPNVSEKMLTTKQAQKLLGVGQTTISRMYRRGELKGQKSGEGRNCALMFRRADVEALRATMTFSAPVKSKKTRVQAIAARAAAAKKPHRESAKRKPAPKPDKRVKMAPEMARGQYELLSAEIGRLTDEKSKQYGDSAQRAGRVMAILYPGGIPTAAFKTALLVIRICDKLCRIATQDLSGVDGGGEDAWRDIAGYGLIGSSTAAAR